MTKEEEYDYILEVIDHQINNWDFFIKLLEDEKENLTLDRRNAICYNITFAEGNKSSLNGLKRVIEEKSYREVLHSDEHEANEI